MRWRVRVGFPQGHKHAVPTKKYCTQWWTPSQRSGSGPLFHWAVASASLSCRSTALLSLGQFIAADCCVNNSVTQQFYSYFSSNIFYVSWELQAWWCSFTTFRDVYTVLNASERISPLCKLFRAWLCLFSSTVTLQALRVAKPYF
jgi:hypothetical protein